jgi:transposase-like protein
MEKIIKTLMENFLMESKKKNINPEERIIIIKQLLKIKNCSARSLAKELIIPHSTLHDWLSLRQDNTGENIHISFSAVVRKLKSINPKTFNDWGRLEQIKELIIELEKRKIR